VPRERQRRPRREDVIEHLLTAASRVFAERGYEGASVELISEEAGYSTGALYSNFKSKEGLFLKLFESRISRRAVELREAIAKGGGGTSGLAAAASSFASTLEQEHEWFLLYLEFAMRAARDAKFRQPFRARREAALVELAGGIHEGLKQAGLTPSMTSEELARATRAVIHGFAVERILGEVSGKDSLPSDVITMVFRAATGHPPSQSPPSDPRR
jgi:AcrR family transcriptional regulator